MATTLTINDWAQLATVVAAAANVVSLLAVAFQLRSLGAQTKLLAEQTMASAKQTEAAANAIQATAHHADFLSATRVDRAFLEHPELRERFYGKVGIGENAVDEQRVEAMAELMIDNFALITTQNVHATEPVADGFVNFVAHIVNNSPDLRRTWRKYRDWYQIPELRALIDPHLPAHDDGDSSDVPLPRPPGS